jgi:hypothetical protein
MRLLLLIGGLAAAAVATTGNAAPAPSLSPSMKQDLQCFVLYTVAAGSEKDEKKLTGAIAGTWYFLGRIDVAAPAIDLDSAMRAEIKEMEGSPRTKEIGSACDARFSRRGSDMINLGKNFQSAVP